MLLIDTAAKRIISDEEIKKSVALSYPYEEWIEQHIVKLSDIPTEKIEEEKIREDLIQAAESLWLYFRRYR